MKFSWNNFLNKYTRTVGKRSKVDEIVTIALLTQRMFGQQILDPQWTWKNYYFHQIIHLCIFVYVFFGTLEVMRTTNDSELIAEASYTLIMIMLFASKMILYIKNRNVFRGLYVTTKTTLMDTIKVDSEEKFERVLKTGSRAVKALFLIILIPMLIYQSTTLWNYINGQRTLLSRTTASLMPMTTPYYELAWLIHSLFLCEVSTIIIPDMWFVLLAFFLCKADESLIKVLNVRQKQNEETCLSYSTRLSEALRQFHTVHVKLNRCLIALRKMYKWLALVPLCNAAMCTCLSLLIMSKEINWRFAPHMAPMITEIFAYNWFGEQLKTKAEEINNAILNFDWTDLNIKDKKCYFIILTCTQNEFGIKTAVGNELSLITMSTVLKVIYQTFAVLRTIDK
nr:odorant receptor 2 [Papilio glaucus]